MEHDWNSDGSIDTDDRFVEFENLTGSSQNLAGYTVTTVDSNLVEDTYTIVRGTWAAGGMFVVFGELVDVPAYGTVYLRNASGTLLAMMVRNAGPGPGKSWQWNGTTYIVDLPTPGVAWPWWNTRPTPTPANITATPTVTPTP